jgi:predicted signal transduction protein with EAL and GGDEF domain
MAAQDLPDAGTILKNADVALTFAKTFGRNSVRFFSRELSERAFHDYTIQRRVADGFRNGEYRVDYQPYCELANGRISGAEALLRWENGELGPCRPRASSPSSRSPG